MKSCHVIVVEKYCDWTEFDAGLKLGEDYGWDIRETEETLLDFWLEVQTLFITKSRAFFIKEFFSYLI